MSVRLLDIVFQASGTDAGEMSYVVEIVDRYHDGPGVPGVVGRSEEFSGLDALSNAWGWANRAVAAFIAGMLGEAAR